MIGWGVGRWGLPYKQEFLNHLLHREYFATVLGLDRGNNCGNHRCQHTYYQLLEEGVYSLRISYNFFKTGNYFKKYIYICDLGRDVKTRGSGCCYFYFFFKDIEIKEIYSFGSSYAVDKLLHGRLDVRSLLITCIMLKLVDGIGKALDFY